MRGVWTWPAVVGIAVGVALFVVLFVPALAVQYRRYGRPSPVRLVAVAAACVYAVALVAYTLLPLPTGDLTQWCAQHAAGHNLHPLAAVHDVRAEVAAVGPAAALHSFVVLQLVLNVALFVPWGVLVRLLLRWGVVRTTATAALVSTLIEVTQYTGIFGLIGCSYRVGDVDDVILNTSGALVGALLAPALSRRVPSSGALARERGAPRPVTVGRRWAAMAVDAALALGLALCLDLAWSLVQVLRGATSAEPAVTSLVLGDVVPLVVVFVAPALLGSGASWGQRTVWLTPRWPDRARWTRRLARALASGGAWWVLTSAPEVPGLDDGVASLLAVLGWLVAVVAVAAAPFTRGRRGLSCAWTGGVLDDARVSP